MTNEDDNLGENVTAATSVSSSFTAPNNDFLCLINVLPRI